VLRGGPRGAIEALYALQVEEANALRADMRKVVEEHRADMREVVEELRAHHGRYQEMAALRATADNQIIEAVAALAANAKALETLWHQANSMPERVQAVINSADVTELHRRLAESLTLDICAHLGTNSDTEAKRFTEIASRIESSVHAAVQNLRDANAGKPILPPVTAEGTVTERLWSRARYYYVHLLRLTGDLQPLEVIFAGACVGLTAIAILIGQIVRATLSH
jgi:chromosome segregation ATPase